MLGRVVDQGLTALPERRRGVWGDFLPLLRGGLAAPGGAQLVACNLECAVTHAEELAPKTFNFRLHPANIEVLKCAAGGSCEQPRLAPVPGTRGGWPAQPHPPPSPPPSPGLQPQGGAHRLCVSGQQPQPGLPRSGAAGDHGWAAAGAAAASTRTAGSTLPLTVWSPLGARRRAWHLRAWALPRRLPRRRCWSVAGCAWLSSPTRTTTRSGQQDRTSWASTS